MGLPTDAQRSEGVILAGGRRFALEAAARKGREHRVRRVQLQRGALLNSSGVLAEEVRWEFRVPEVSHLIVLLVKAAVELVLQRMQALSAFCYNALFSMSW